MHVLITGANRGIGHAIYQAYQADGHTVTGTARNAAGYERLDVTKPEDHSALASRLDGQAIDLLVCNAGVYLDKRENLADGFSAEIWAQTLLTNVTGVFLSVQSLLPALQLSKAPKIAIISSRMGSQDRPKGGSYAYRASKAAALNLGRNLATDLKPLGVPVGIYHPGWVRTDMGGAEADVSVTDAAHGLIKEFDALGPETTGCFRTWDGQDLPF